MGKRAHDLDHQAANGSDPAEHLVFGDILDDTAQGFDRHSRPQPLASRLNDR